MKINCVSMLRRPRRRAQQRGAYAVEMSIVLVPMMALVFAIFDFSMPLFIRTMFMNAVREGVRLGITHGLRYPPVTGTLYNSQTEAIQACVQAYSLGLLNSSNSSLIKVKYYQLQNVSGSSTFVEKTGANSNIAGNVIEVSVTGYSWGVIAPLLRSGGAIPTSAISSDRLEVLPPGTTTPPNP